MKLLKVLLVGAGILSGAVCIGQDVGSQAFYAEKYGAPVSTAECAEMMLHYGPSPSKQVAVHSEFRLVLFQQDDVQVRAIYAAKENKLVLVETILPERWSQEQLFSALAIYEDLWIPVKDDGITMGYATRSKYWANLAPFGFETRLRIQTPFGSELAAAAQAEEVKRTSAKVVFPGSPARTTK